MVNESRLIPLEISTVMAEHTTPPSVALMVEIVRILILNIQDAMKRTYEKLEMATVMAEQTTPRCCIAH